MATNLTGSTIASTYDQLLHVSDGPEATEKTVYSGVGVATAVKIGTQSASVDNIQLDGNTISTLNTNGNLVLSPNGTGSVSIAKVAITGGSVSGITDLAITDGGTGASNISDARTNLGLGSMATQNANNVAITGGTITGVSFSGSFSGLTLVESTTFATSGVAAGCTLTGSSLTADGTDTNIDITITPKGTGEVNITNVDIGGGTINDVELGTAFPVTEAQIDNININGNTISSTDTDGDIDITPDGTGEVNITNVDILSGSVPFNTITNRAYASFYDADTADQTGSTTDKTAVEWATALVTGAGITIASNSRITFTVAGTYRISVRIQVQNVDTSDHDVTFWFAKGGSNIASSTSKITVPKAGDGGKAVFSSDLLNTVSAGEYIELYWYPEDTDVTLHYVAPIAASPGVTPAIPATPPAIVIAERIA